MTTVIPIRLFVMAATLTMVCINLLYLAIYAGPISNHKLLITRPVPIPHFTTNNNIWHLFRISDTGFLIFNAQQTLHYCSRNSGYLRMTVHKCNLSVLYHKIKDIHLKKWYKKSLNKIVLKKWYKTPLKTNINVAHLHQFLLSHTSEKAVFNINHTPPSLLMVVYW